MPAPTHDIGLIGLAVMGQNLVLNMANHGFSVGVYNRTTATTDEFIASLPNEREDKVLKGTIDRVKGYHTLEDFVASLKSPKRVMIMVKYCEPRQPPASQRASRAGSNERAGERVSS